MNQSMDFIVKVIHDEVVQYSGFFALFITALVYLFCQGRKKEEIHGFMWISMILILLFCFPFFMQISISKYINSEDYFRILQFAPIVPVLSYVFVNHFEEQNNRRGKIIWIFFIIFLLCCAGNPVYIQTDWYEDGYSAKNPNLEEQIEICEFLYGYDSDAVVVVRKEFLPLIRQVSGGIKLIYGYDIQEGGYSEEIEKLFKLMQSENEGDLEQLVQGARAQGAEYLIMDRWWESRQESGVSAILDSDVEMIFLTEHYQVFAI